MHVCPGVNKKENGKKKLYYENHLCFVCVVLVGKT